MAARETYQALDKEPSSSRISDFFFQIPSGKNRCPAEERHISTGDVAGGRESSSRIRQAS